GARPGGHGGSGSPRRARRGSAPPARGRRRRSRRAPAGAGRCEPSRRSYVSRSSICSSSAWMIVSIASTLARAGSGNTSARCPTVAPRRSNSRPRPQGQPSWVSRCVQALRPAVAVLSERVAQAGAVAQVLDLSGRQPGLWQHLLGQEPREPGRVEPDALRPTLRAAQSARLARVAETHLEAARLRPARDPTPPRRRLERDRLELPHRSPRPAIERL